MLEHQHLIIRAEVNKPPTSPEWLKQWLVQIIQDIGMNLAKGLEANPISYYCELDGNQGLTGAAILETSHTAFHSWDDVVPAVIQYDIYSCSAVDITKIISHFDQFEPIKLEYKFLDRATDLIELSSGKLTN